MIEIMETTEMATSAIKETGITETEIKETEIMEIETTEIGIVEIDIVETTSTSAMRIAADSNRTINETPTAGAGTATGDRTLSEESAFLMAIVSSLSPGPTMPRCLRPRPATNTATTTVML